jgi:5-methylcytosine-specific restriction endonuclease McrBC GTP-binding regulatory subunit McrB
LNSSQYKKLLEFNKNLILYGPPGTGKTYKANEILKSMTANQNNEQKSTWKTITSLVLLENNGLPLHYNEISKRALEQNLKNTSGKTPEQTILRDIGKDIESHNEISFFMKSEDGIYGLNLPFTFKKATEFVLFANNKPMKKNDIAKQIIEHNLVESNGETPERTLSTEILRDKDNGEDSVFIQLDNQLITLRGISNFSQPIDENNNFIRRVTFHPSYSYEDFVEGFRPNVNDEGTQPYILNDGIFKEICNAAKNDLENNYVLLIDEINRGNIPKIFGELITLIEKDKRKIENSLKLTYSKDDFFVPKNLIIIGTMNTADKSLVQMDEALRRRFVFEELMPEPDLLETLNRPGKKYKDILENINKKIIEGNNIKQFRDRQIGHSYFMDEPFGDKELRLVIKYQIIPLLQDYFYDDYEEIKRILGSKIIGPDNRPGKILDDGNESELIRELRSHLNNKKETTDAAKNPDEELN